MRPRRAGVALLRAAYGAARRVVRAVPWLHRLRPKAKRRLLATTLGRLTPRLDDPDRPLELHGVRLLVPPELTPTYALESYAPEIRALLSERLSPGMRVADVGANIGLLTLLAARLVAPSGQVWAVEPAPDNLAWLRRNLALNGELPVTVVAAAAGAVPERRRLHLGKLGTTHSLDSPGPDGRSVPVDVLPLDRAIEGRVDLVKIDAEGHEIEVLAGMERLLAAEPPPLLIIEWSPSLLRRAGHRAEELPRFLEARGYRLTVLDDERDRGVEALLSVLEDRPDEKPWRVDLLAEPPA